MKSSLGARLGAATSLALLFGASAVSAAPSAETVHRLEVFGQVLALSEANHVTPIDEEHGLGLPSAHPRLGSEPNQPIE